MRAGYYKEIIQKCFDKEGLGTITSTMTLGALTLLPAMSLSDSKNYLIKKYNLKTSDHAMVVSVKLFDSIDDYQSYLEFPSEADEPEEISFMVINDTNNISK